MKLKGKQLKRVRRYRAGDPLKRKVARLRHIVNKKIKAPIGEGIIGQFDINIQMTQPLPTTIDINAWHNEFDAKALCHLFGVPYEVYQASQTNKV